MPEPGNPDSSSSPLAKPCSHSIESRQAVASWPSLTLTSASYYSMTQQVGCQLRAVMCAWNFTEIGGLQGGRAWRIGDGRVAAQSRGAHPVTAPSGSRRPSTAMSPFAEESCDESPEFPATRFLEGGTRPELTSQRGSTQRGTSE